MEAHNIISLLFTSLLLVSTVNTEPGPPLILMPGILGNQIEGKLNRTDDQVPYWYCRKTSDWYTFWLSLEAVLPLEIYCLSDQMKLKYDPTTGKYSDNDGVQTRVPGFGMTSSVEYLDPSTKFSTTTNYYHNMVEHFTAEEKGYTRGKDIVGVPYDWRVSPTQLFENGYYDDLKAIIEKTYSENGKKRVILIAHSMGAINSLFFLTKVVDQEWKDTYIQTFITIAGAWRGAAKSAKAFASGDNEGIVIDKDIWGREGQRASPSTAWLLPYPSDTWTKDDILAVTDKRQYTAWDYEDFFKDMKYPRGYQMFNEIRNLTGQLIPPNVTLHCIYGGKVDTPMTFKYGPGEFPDTDPTTINGDGDGTVNINSLKSCERWKGQQAYDVTSQQVTGIDHVQMIRDQSIIDIVDKIVYPN